MPVTPFSQNAKTKLHNVSPYSASSASVRLPGEAGLFYPAKVDTEQNAEAIRERIAAACERSGRPLDAVKLMAASKAQPPERIEALAACGVTLFGESKIQEAKAKISRCPDQLHWHMIGHLQSNKVRDAVGLFEMIQTVDRLSLAEEIQKWAEKEAKTMPVLLEVNIAGETSKHGYAPDRLLAEVTTINSLPRIEVHGLMTLPPWSPHPEKARPLFRRLRELKEECQQRLGAPLSELSIGMSADFEVAIEEGSTLVRIGTALFGERKTG